MIKSLVSFACILGNYILSISSLTTFLLHGSIRIDLLAPISEKWVMGIQSRVFRHGEPSAEVPDYHILTKRSSKTNNPQGLFLPRNTGNNDLFLEVILGELI